MSEFVPIFLTDKSTFCTYIYNACVAQGKTPVADKRDFVNDCAARYPTTIKEDFTLKGIRYRWEFNGDYATALKYEVSPSRNFTVWEKINPELKQTPLGNGQSVLQKVADGQTDKCDKFGRGPGAQPATNPLGVGRNVLLAPAERVALDLPGDGYPEPAFIPGRRSDTASTNTTWVHAADFWRSTQDKIVFGAALVLGVIILCVTKGALPNLEATTPALSPFSDPTRRDPRQL